LWGISVKIGRIFIFQGGNMSEPATKKYALLSVSDKTGIDAFAEGLVRLGYEIVSSGGTAAALTKAGIKNIAVQDVTGFAECLDGRVKTLHPKIHAGILANRKLPAHMKQLAELGINPIDIVCVNLYPFAKTIAKPGCTMDMAVENIDIGGPCMIRAAAKNFHGVTVICDPKNYGLVLEGLEKGTLGIQERQRLAQEAFAHTAFYDGLIQKYLKAEELLFQPQAVLPFKLEDIPRYGENADQAAAVYFDPMCTDPLSLKFAKKLGGKQMSYNNYSDAQAAVNMLVEMGSKEPVCAIVKHEMCCGVAKAKNLYEAYTRARDADPVSYFGGIVGFNKMVDAKTAQAILDTWAKGTFVEIVIAPKYDPKALDILKGKENLRVLELAALGALEPVYGVDYKVLNGVMLAQVRQELAYDSLKFVTKTKPTEQQLKDLMFAFDVCKHAKSNGIVLAQDNATVGIGGGPGRRDLAAKIAVWQVERLRPGIGAKGAVAASDAFFPFSDGPEELIKAGVTAIIQPGGSARDQDSIDLCDKYKIPMVFTGQRVFSHSAATSIPGKKLK